MFVKHFYIPSAAMANMLILFYLFCSGKMEDNLAGIFNLFDQDGNKVAGWKSVEKAPTPRSSPLTSSTSWCPCSSRSPRERKTMWVVVVIMVITIKFIFLVETICVERERLALVHQSAKLNHYYVVIFPAPAGPGQGDGGDVQVGRQEQGRCETVDIPHLSHIV